MAQFKNKPKQQPLKKSESPIEGRPAFNWFPGHMMKALRDIKSKMTSVDLVIEMRDARAPIVTGNRSLVSAIGGKSRLILLNKANLADPQMNELWGKYFDKEGIPYLFVNCLDRSSMREVISLSKKIIESKREGNNVAKKDKYKLMIVGIPNIGKSTFINAIANRNATKVANKPGQTQVQLWVKVDDEIDLLDTPGVMPPEIEREEHKIWLSIINAIPDGLVGEEDPAIYLVQYFLKNKTPEFLNRFKIDSPDITVDEALVQIAAVRGCLKQKGLPDLNRVYKIILQDFRAGEIGRVSFGKAPPLA